ncbi:ArsR/SmtB family transcription factor [Isoptericola cucumis]|uniref:Transcriptional regulator n=1 Tax=Isoptericola cucumis TaxID=1776856 RepID=A0ABQ2B2U6_9MICO|nr:metalloregulator ArsR/SmtB family transcription factor [Isoptericola cucumis]GGI06647.1 transcriptional regulator [Isoptericola cucumis]
MDTRPLYGIKAELFKSLAHPARLQVLEVLAAAPGLSAPVSRLQEVTGAEPSALSQHLAVLKRAGVVTSTRAGNAVEYRLTEPLVAELLVVARAFLLHRLAGDTDAERLAAARDLPALPGASARTVLDAAGTRAPTR